MTVHSQSHETSTTLYIDNGMTNVQHWDQRVVVNCNTPSDTFRELLKTDDNTQVHTITGKRAAFTQE